MEVAKLNPSRASLISFAGILLAAAEANAVVIGGVDFPDGAASFADQVVSYSPGTDVGSGPGVWDDPSQALGVPDYDAGTLTGATSLGEGGELVLQFTDNSLTTSGDNSLDLYIFEIGDVVELFNVAISTDGVSWIDLGDVDGQPTGIDIDPIAGVTAGALYSFVRLRDVLPAQTDFPFGEADIDAVGAISSAPASIPEPSTLGLLVLGALGAFTVKRKSSLPA